MSAAFKRFINAILGEERLVPTNCMLAQQLPQRCHLTILITKEKYRAEIEFIKPEDWKEDLELP